MQEALAPYIILLCIPFVPVLKELNDLQCIIDERTQMLLLLLHTKKLTIKLKKLTDTHLQFFVA